MNKLIKLGIGIFLIIISCGAYYSFVINSEGTTKISYIEPDDEYNSFLDILGHPDLKGKVVYVDYWHTGCKPCLEEFEYLPALKEKFKERKDLAFLYLGKDRSAPGEKFRWKKTIEKRNLSGHHYFMTKGKYDKLWSETINDTSIMQAFPHYLIVDRNGRIINNNAPRPSDKLLETSLFNALNN
jgi:thiol-disulfide isomerase/thioredoxin